MSDISQLIHELGDPRRAESAAVRLLYQTYPAPEPAVCEMAAEVLCRIGQARARILCRALADERREVRLDALSELGKAIYIHNPTVVQSLCDALNDDDPYLRSLAADALGGSKNPDVVQHLRRALADKDVNVRATAARSLGLIGGPDVVKPLCEALKDRVPAVGEMAAWALRHIAEKEPVLSLRAALPSLDRLARWGRRADYRPAADAIRVATADLAQHPLPASSLLANSSTLPLPAAPTESNLSDLPVPSPNSHTVRSNST